MKNQVNFFISIAKNCLQTKESKLAPKKHFSLFHFKFKNSNSVLWLGLTLLVTSYWLHSPSQNQFSPFLPSKAFQFEFKLSLSNSPVDYNSASYWPHILLSKKYYKYRNFLIFNKYIFFGWGDCANFFLAGTAKAALPTSGRHHSHLFSSYSLYCKLNMLNEN